MAKRIRKIREREQLHKILEMARASEKNPPRKHHVVPRSYLARWQHNEQLWLTDLLERRTFRSSAEKAARETDFYRLDGDGVDPNKVPPLVVETILSLIEGEAVNVVGRVAGQPIAGEDQFTLCHFVGLQVLRGRHFRAAFEHMSAGMMQRVFDGMTPEEVRARFGPDVPDEKIAAYLDAHERLRQGDVRVVPTKATSISVALSMLDTFGFLLFRRRWLVYNASAPLVTSDEPVILLGGRNMPRGGISGVMTAGVVLFPLDPSHLLVMFDPALHLDEDALKPNLTHEEVAELNLEITAMAHRLRIARGDLPRPAVPSLPPRPPEALVEKEVPITNLDDHTTVIHTFHPSPWLYAPDQPLPVARWWTHDDRVLPWSRGDTPWVPPTGVALTDEGLADHYTQTDRKPNGR